MLYLEDYLEMIEHLPQELRDRFTEMREMDLQVQNSMDSLEKQVKLFFSRAKKLKPQEREAEHAAILKDYYKTLEDAGKYEKVQMASQIYELVDRYLRRLDQELHKFKMELEADNKGITELLEKRSLELDQPAANSAQKENRYSLGMTRAEKRQASGAPQALAEKKVALERGVGGQAQASEPRPTSTSMALVPATPVSFSLSHIGAGSTAIAAAASQAIAATQQMQQGRRTASLKASYEAINTGVHPHELSIGRELAGAAQSAIAAAILPETTKKQKKRGGSSAASSPLQPTGAPSTSTVAPTLLSATLPVVPSPPTLPKEETVPYEATLDPNAENPDWTYDPNEPRYCICNQVSYGDMVACDNEDCPFEWFHYPCVNITAPPKGKWYCPQCTTNMKRRGARK
ncbi:hypothetical protein B566_EDAN002944 [Ephemera danica]|nr:hypothetical protein B566_EDAN002944 [Ephemera danica]